jgi:hypothetical protein
MEIRCSCVNFIFNLCAKVNIPLQINLDMKENVITVFCMLEMEVHIFILQCHDSQLGVPTSFSMWLL